MSLLIKGMETPDIENNKSIKAEIRNLDGKLELGIMTGGYYCSQQWTYYPIVSVPTPHGRLIDADKANDNAYDVLEICYDMHPWEAAREMQKIFFRDAPTVIEAEE